MHDTLLAGGAVKESDTVIGAVFTQLVHHGLRQRIGVGLDELIGRHDVIHGRKGAVREGDLQPKIAQHAEGLGRSDLVDEVRADEQLRLAVGQLADGVGVPDFLEERLRHGQEWSRFFRSRLPWSNKTTDYQILAYLRNTCSVTSDAS